MRYILVLFLLPWLVFAQGATSLPSAGLTPESAFYFLDKLGEALQEFFTFNSEGKARLQITFAAERIAEIKVILETKGVEAKGLAIAQARLQEHLGDAAEIVVKQKGKGKDVNKLAKELNDELEASKSALDDSFKAEKRALKEQAEELKAQLKAAHRAGDTAKAEALAQELGQVKSQKELLELKEEDIEDELEAEEEKLEEEIEELDKKQEKKKEAEEAIKEAEEEKQEVLAGIVVMDGNGGDDLTKIQAILLKFDKLLVQAKELFAKENYVGAKQLAKQAEKSLEQIEDDLDELEEVREKEEELKEEQEEKEQEVREEQEEKDQAAKNRDGQEEEDKDEDESDAMILPTVGSAITIKDCKASPRVLQVSKGAEITIINSDDETRTLMFYDFATGGQGSLELPANGQITTAKLSTPVNTTNNFSCDNKSLPYGGAVFVQP